MCVPCCSLCYEKYIEKDGTIDEAKVEQLIGEDSMIVNGLVLSPDNISYQLCTCDCHKKGMYVMH